MLDIIWHDPVGSAAIAGLIVLAVAGFANWFWMGLRTKRAVPTAPQLVVRTLLIALPIAILLWFAQKLGEWSVTHAGPHFFHTITSVGLPLVVGFVVAVMALQRSAAQAKEKHGGSGGPPQPPVRFDPEAFKMTPLRSRALLALLGRVEARTTLYDLHEAVTEYDYEGRHYVDTSQSRGRLQHDMDNAESVGIVTIERLPNGTSHYYALTAQGRDWVLLNETVLKAMAPVDMTQKARVRYT
jgi:hypothetical protein